MTQLTETSKAPRKEYAPGDVIGGKYGLLRLLGEGGMGSVWVAENMALKANVALKLIRADVAEASANERFLSEARLAARLQHAAIVRVFDFGKTEHDEPFIVMELLEGETLGQRLARRGSIESTELVQTLLPIIDALHSAHGHGVIHRDLKPDNVFVAKSEGGVQPKLLDFGIAKLRGESAFFSTKLTQAGTLIGSPDYMSPEQARGETDLDPRSDVWALCVLAYECLVGKPPFHGDNYNALLWAIIHDDPVPTTVFQAGDPELWRILKRGFAKDRNGRWESARRLGEALAAWLESRGVLEDACNRSLQSSWLPAERPTRPELTPFDGVGGSLAHRGLHHTVDASPPPTLIALRRPHTMSLWFAGLGLLTLVGALFLSKVEGEPEATGAGHQEVDSLRPVPGPAPETREAVPLPPSDLGGHAPSAPLLRGTSQVDQQGPIGAVPSGAKAASPSGESGSWKDNHDPALHGRGPRLGGERSGRLGKGSEDDAASDEKRTRSAEKASKATPSKASPSRASKRATRARAKPARSASKRAAAEKKPAPEKKPVLDPLEMEVDFGI